MLRKGPKHALRAILSLTFEFRMDGQLAYIGNASAMTRVEGEVLIRGVFD